MRMDDKDRFERLIEMAKALEVASKKYLAANKAASLEIDKQLRWIKRNSEVMVSSEG